MRAGEVASAAGAAAAGAGGAGRAPVRDSDFAGDSDGSCVVGADPGAIGAAGFAAGGAASCEAASCEAASCEVVACGVGAWAVGARRDGTVSGRDSPTATASPDTVSRACGSVGASRPTAVRITPEPASSAPVRAETNSAAGDPSPWRDPPARRAGDARCDEGVDLGGVVARAVAEEVVGSHTGRWEVARCDVARWDVAVRGIRSDDGTGRGSGSRRESGSGWRSGIPRRCGTRRDGSVEPSGPGIRLDGTAESFIRRNLPRGALEEPGGLRVQPMTAGTVHNDYVT